MLDQAQSGANVDVFDVQGLAPVKSDMHRSRLHWQLVYMDFRLALKIRELKTVAALTQLGLDTPKRPFWIDQSKFL